MVDPAVFYPPRLGEARMLLAEVCGHFNHEIRHLDDGAMKDLVTSYRDRIDEFLDGPSFHFNADQIADEAGSRPSSAQPEGEAGSANLPTISSQRVA